MNMKDIEMVDKKMYFFLRFSRLIYYFLSYIYCYSIEKVVPRKATFTENKVDRYQEDKFLFIKIQTFQLR